MHIHAHAHLRQLDEFLNLVGGLDGELGSLADGLFLGRAHTVYILRVNEAEMDLNELAQVVLLDIHLGLVVRSFLILFAGYLAALVHLLVSVESFQHYIGMKILRVDDLTQLERLLLVGVEHVAENALYFANLFFEKFIFLVSE